MVEYGQPCISSISVISPEIPPKAAQNPLQINEKNFVGIENRAFYCREDSIIAFMLVHIEQLTYF